MCVCVCEWVNVSMYCRVLVVVVQTRKGLRNCSPFTVMTNRAGGYENNLCDISSDFVFHFLLDAL